MERLEAEVLLDALEQADWNQTATAKRLKMPRRTLVHKIKVHGLNKR
jgi:DNA-binding NtrC family response regulator